MTEFVLQPSTSIKAANTNRYSQSCQMQSGL